MRIDEIYETHPLAEEKLSHRKLGLSGRYATEWIRFDAYEIREDAQGHAYLVPEEDSKFELYNPFEVAESLLMDILKLGDAYSKYLEEMKEVDLNAYRKRKTEKIWQGILESLKHFAVKYGLLGFMNSSTYNHSIVGDGTVLLSEGNLLDLDAAKMDEKPYLNLFTPFVKPGAYEVQMYKQRAYVAKYEDTPKFYGKRPIILDLMFSSFYAENIQWILSFSKMLSAHYNQLQVYRKSARALTEPVTIMADAFQARKIGFTIIQGHKTQIAWEFDSLQTAIQTIYGFALTEGAVILKRCEHCGGFYFAGNQREKYCSEACRNRRNVQRSRERKKK